jgi:hypothetical protein
MKNKSGGYAIGGTLTSNTADVAKQFMKGRKAKPTKSKAKGKKGGKKFNSSKYESARKKFFGMK